MHLEIALAFSTFFEFVFGLKRIPSEVLTVYFSPPLFDDGTELNQNNSFFHSVEYLNSFN